jgi:hypothetical protein
MAFSIDALTCALARRPSSTEPPTPQSPLGYIGVMPAARTPTSLGSAQSGLIEIALTGGASDKRAAAHAALQWRERFDQRIFPVGRVTLISQAFALVALIATPLALSSMPSAAGGSTIGRNAMVDARRWRQHERLSRQDDTASWPHQLASAKGCGGAIDRLAELGGPA